MQLVSFERRTSDTVSDRNDAGRRPASLGDSALGFESLEATRPGVRRLGAVLPGGPHAGSIVDLNRALAIRLAGEDVGAPEAEADSLLPARDARLPATRARGARDRARRARIRRGRRRPLRRSRSAARRSGRAAPARAPVGARAAAAQDHCRRAQLPRARSRARRAAPPSEPVLFLKATSAVIGPDDEIWLPAASARVDWEGELAVVIGSTRARRRAQPTRSPAWPATRSPTTSPHATSRTSAASTSSANPATPSHRSAPPSSPPTRFPTPRIWASARWCRARRCRRRAPRR